PCREPATATHSPGKDATMSGRSPTTFPPGDNIAPRPTLGQIIHLRGDLADQVLPAVDKTVAELAKLNAAMDRLMVSTGEGVIPALRNLAEQLIAFLDIAEGWDEREEENEHGDSADDEPSLGAAESVNQVRTWSASQNPTRDDREEQDEDGDELDKLEGSDLDISGEADGNNGGIVDDEPSLGSL